MKDKVEKEEELTVDRLISGDRPSIYAFGMIGAHAIRTAGIAIFMVDVMGRVHIMPPSSVSVVSSPKISWDELHQMEEDQALQVLLREGHDEQTIIRYLKERKKINEAYPER